MFQVEKCIKIKSLLVMSQPVCQIETSDSIRCTHRCVHSQNRNFKTLEIENYQNWVQARFSQISLEWLAINKSGQLRHIELVSQVRCATFLSNVEFILYHSTSL